MYVIIYGLHNAGLTAALVQWLEPIVNQHLLYASFAMGGLVSILSNVFNNHPALMIGTITLTEMGLDPVTLKTIYLANIIGSDIGSLLLPIGTLASLIWMYILKQNKIKVKWKDYLSVSLSLSRSQQSSHYSSYSTGYISSLPYKQQKPHLLPS